MATLANQGMASQMAFGQHGSAFIDGANEYTAPAGKVVVAMTFLEETVFMFSLTGRAMVFAAACFIVKN